MFSQAADDNQRTEAEDEMPPIGIATNAWMRGIDDVPTIALDFTDGWRKCLLYMVQDGAAHMSGDCVEVPYHSLYSGSNQCEVTMACIAASLASYDMRVKFVHKAACERVPEKIQHIIDNTSAQHCFVDCDRMCDDMVEDGRKAQKEFVPAGAALIVGFPCTSKTMLNVGAKDNAYCIQKGEGATGRGWKSTQEYIRLFRFTIVIIENVKELDIDPLQTGFSDLEFITKELTEAGYFVRSMLVDATEFGSFADRVRLYIICIKRERSAIADGQARTFSQSVMSAQKVARLAPEDFIELHYDDYQEMMDLLGVPLGIPGVDGSCRKHEPDFRREHMQLYQVFGITWPPPPSVFEASRYSLLVGLNERTKELVHIICSASSHIV